MSKDYAVLYVDENVVRWIAGQTLLIVIGSLVGHWTMPFYFLAMDFFLRAFTQWPSPLAFSGKMIVRWFGLKPRQIFAAPKKFAAALGFIFSSVAIVFFILQMGFAGMLTGSILIFCALMESAFRICLGCYIYQYVVTPVRKIVSSVP